MSKEQLLANSLEMIGARLNRFIKTNDTSIIKNALEDLQKTLNEYYDGDYSYWD